MKRAAAIVAIMMAGGVPLPAQTRDSSDLSGLWMAKRRLGPEARGPVLVTRTPAGLVADMMGFSVPVNARDGMLTFELPDRRGEFRGKQQPDGSIRGVWIQPNTPGLSGTATPLNLLRTSSDRWSGEVVPLDDEQTFYLLLRKQPDGTMSALLRNIERDFGAQLGVQMLLRTGHHLTLIGRRAGRYTPVASGSYDADRQTITLEFPNRGGSYDFQRDDDGYSGFYVRGRAPAHYVYRAPPALDDGWTTAGVDDVGIERTAIERAVQQVIDLSMDSIHAPQVHSLLIARKGKLVLEEYFHGEHRDKLHNVRSASKSVTADLIGAAMLAGAPLRLSSSVYQVMNDGALPPALEPRKRAMTLEHLLTMSSGYFCDDNNENAPGNENGMWDQDAQPDFYQFALQLPMAFAPGERAIYCSINPNLALGVLGRATGESPFFLFDRLLAAPLDIRRYAWSLDYARNPYGGGGMALRSRDFLKFGQLMLDGGVWRGRRILNPEFVARATSPLVRIDERGYGLAWWREEMMYGDRTAKAFAMLGAGGNIVMVFPELELVVAMTAGSYASRGWRWASAVLIPGFILPAMGGAS